MRPTYPLLLAAACLALATARADDAAVQQIRTSREALVKAKAWRRTTVTTDLDTDKARTIVAEFVQPNLCRLFLSELQCFSDGKVNRVCGKDGTVTDADAEMVQLLEFSRDKYSMKGLLDSIKEAHVAERKTFRDLPTTIIAFTVDSDGMVSTGKLWISDADHLPLKIETETHGETKEEPSATRPINQRSAGSFEYGPNIKIVMP